MGKQEKVAGGLMDRTGRRGARGGVSKITGASCIEIQQFAS